MSEDCTKCECYSTPDDCDFLGSTCSQTDCLVKDLIKQLQTAKEENGTLRTEIVERNQQLFKAKDEIKIQTNLAKVNNDVVIKLTQQNKQMKEVLGKILDFNNTKLSEIPSIAQQALKGVE